MKKIAILGATGYIGKSLSYEFSFEKEFEVFLFSRSTKKLKQLLKTIPHSDRLCSLPLKKFKYYKYDAIINCIGIGDSSAIKKTTSDIFDTTEKFDDLIIKYLRNFPKTMYINLSSGAVYGQSFEKPISSKSKLILNINDLRKNTYYSVVKINSEAKHRACSDLNIVDLRIFSFFSHFINPNSNFFMSDVIRYLKNGNELITTPEDMKRDYINPLDLLELIKLCMKRKRLNDFFDVYSLNPISKFDLLDYLKANYGLQYKIDGDLKILSETGSKNQYYSTNKKARYLGYAPKLSSIEGIDRELQKMLSQ